MRTLITFSLAVLVSNNTYAFNMAASNLVISSADNSFISVAINNSAPVTTSTHVNFSNLMPGNHRVKIFRHFMNPGGHWKSRLVYKGFVNVPPASEVVYSINYYNQLVLMASYGVCLNLSKT